MKFKLGDRVSAPNSLYRSKKWRGRHEWREVLGPVKGVFVGWRTYANGTVEIDQDAGPLFTADEWIKVALICQDPRHSPVPVLYDECELL